MSDPVEVIHGDCLKVMQETQAESVDAVVTDPPYGLEFMGKDWDHGIPGVPFWEAALRVAKPGAHLLAFGGTRTHHRLMCAIEDAGWEIRDCLMWVYGSGFPKSLDVGKAIDKCTAPLDALATFQSALVKARKAKGYSRVEVSQRIVGSPSGACWNWEAGLRIPGEENWKNLVDLLDLPAEFQFMREEAEREVVGNNNRKAGWFTAQDGHDITAPATDAAKQWDGWGTALKPAWEPIILARKPLIGTVAANVLEHGTGGLNIDGCRVGYVDDGDKYSVPQADFSVHDGSMMTADNHDKDSYRSGRQAESDAKGRWPANVVHDGSEEVVGLFPQTESGAMNRTVEAYPGDGATGFLRGKSGPHNQRTDSGSAARFFYCAKASRSERDAGLSGEKRPLLWSSCNKNPGSFQSDGTEKAARNNHPTVKPIALMRWLCRLVTPPKGLILDPFCGSFSTGVAAALEGFRCVGIDDKADYVEIARARIAHATAQSVLDLL